MIFFGLRACYGVLRFIMKSGAKGCKVVVLINLRGQRTKSMEFVDGLMIGRSSCQTLGLQDTKNNEGLENSRRGRKDSFKDFKPEICYASTSNGFIGSIDISSDCPLWRHKLHEK